MLGDKKIPNTQKIQVFVQNTFNILSLHSFISVDTVQGNAALQHQTLVASPHWCMPGSGAHLLRDPAEFASDPWDPHPHPSWHLQVLPATKQHLQTNAPHPNTQRELQPLSWV